MIAVSHYVIKTKEKDFHKALLGVIEKAKSFQGYQEIKSLKLEDNDNLEFLLLAKFDNETNYKAWEDSDTRKNWSNELKKFVTKQSKVRHQEGLEFWFDLPKQPNTIVPTKWKMGLVTWLVIFPLILILTSLANKYLTFLHPNLKMLFVSLILVSFMTYFLMPKITKVFAFWIFKK